MAGRQRLPLRQLMVGFLAIAGVTLLGLVISGWDQSGLALFPVAGGGLRSSSADLASRAGTGAKDDRLAAGALDRAGIEGIGGAGIHQAIRKSGVWFPLRVAGPGGAETDPGQAPLAQIPLYITSPSPPRYRAAEDVTYPFQAIGGTPPYRWRANLGVEGFRMDPESGWFTGSSTTPFVAVLEVHVRDTAGTEDSARYYLTVGEDEELEIVTEALPNGRVGEPYQVTLEAKGGIDPYQWSAPDGLPEGFAVDPVTGMLSGWAENGFEEDVLIRVTDLGGGMEEVRLPLRIRAPLEIVTQGRLRPASPGLSYALKFEAEGGVPPLEWSMEEGSLPLDARGQPWTLTAEGELRGIAPLQDSRFSFVVAVRDAAGTMDQKQFELSVRRTLIVVAGRQKAGIAWHPADVAQGLGAAPTGYTVTRSNGLPAQAAPPGTVVYQGTGSNFVDQGLTTGATFTYTLYVHRPGTGAEEFAQAAVAILRFTEGRGVSGVTGDPHADLVKVFRPLSAGGHGAGFVPHNVTGPPDGRGTYAPASQATEVLSLHAVQGGTASASGGQVILAFENNIVESGPGEDFTVFENVLFIGGNPDRRFMEPAMVSVALFEGEWYRFPIDVVPRADTSSTPPAMDPFYYNRGFAGRNATTGDTPTDPTRSGGDAFDLASLGQPGLTWIRYIKLESPGHAAIPDDVGGDLVEHTSLFGSLSGNGSSGFDLDAITAIHP